MLASITTGTSVLYLIALYAPSAITKISQTGSHLQSDIASLAFVVGLMILAMMTFIGTWDFVMDGRFEKFFDLRRKKVDS